MRPFLLLTLALAAACGGDEDDCGAPSDGSYPGISVDGVTFGGFASSPNNDCTPVQGDPTSLTIQGEQSDPDGVGFLVLCLPRPFEIENDEPVSLASDQLVQVIDLFGEAADGCSVRLEDPSGATATFSGYCDDGAHEAGYVLLLSGAMTVTRTCGDQDPVTEEVDVSGAAPVVADQL